MGTRFGGRHGPFDKKLLVAFAKIQNFFLGRRRGAHASAQSIGIQAPHEQLVSEKRLGVSVYREIKSCCHGFRSYNAPHTNETKPSRQ
jgi:hypothetical protein